MPKDTKLEKSSRQKTKDKVLQARIPEQLDEELRTRAEHLGLSVSTIVRNVLLHTFDLVEGVVTDSSQIAKVLTGWTATPTQPDADSTVIGWQEAILNKNGVCEQCNTILPVGERAAIGVPTGSRPVILCLGCLSSVSSGKKPPKPPATKKGMGKRASKAPTSARKPSK
jgi:hypothetical protein